MQEINMNVWGLYHHLINQDKSRWGCNWGFDMRQPGWWYIGYYNVPHKENEKYEYIDYYASVDYENDEILFMRKARCFENEDEPSRVIVYKCNAQENREVDIKDILSKFVKNGFVFHLSI